MKKMLIAAVTAAGLMTGGALMLQTSGDNVAAAQSSAKAVVDAAKSRGEIGERIDGYLGVVGSPSAAVRAAMDEINIGRKSVYTELAREQNVKTEVVARLTGEKQIVKAGKGEFIMDESGQWKKK